MYRTDPVFDLIMTEWVTAPLARKSTPRRNSPGTGSSMSPAQIGVLNLHPGWVQTEMGGSLAPVTVKESTAGIVSVIEGFLGKTEQKFIDFQGNEMAW